MNSTLGLNLLASWIHLWNLWSP